MKTEKIMQRQFLGGAIRQNHKTQMMNLNDLELIGNEWRRKAGLPEKQLTHYFKNQSSQEFISSVSLEVGISEKDLIESKKGRSGGSWCHPLIFVDVAMWFNPDFKVKVLQWFMDSLLDSRDESGESCKKMRDALKVRFGEKMSSFDYVRLSNKIAAVCMVGTDEDKWEKATIEQLKKRDKIQQSIALIADAMPDLASCVNYAIKKIEN